MQTAIQKTRVKTMVTGCTLVHSDSADSLWRHNMWHHSNIAEPRHAFVRPQALHVLLGVVRLGDGPAGTHRALLLPRQSCSDRGHPPAGEVSPRRQLAWLLTVKVQYSSICFGGGGEVWKYKHSKEIFWKNKEGFEGFYYLENKYLKMKVWHK